MKNSKLFVPVAMTATLAFVVTCALSCAKKNSAVENPLPAPSEPLPAATVAASTNEASSLSNTNSIISAITVTNVAAETNAVEKINQPPPIATAVGETDAATTSATNLPGHLTVVEMPTTIPAAPTNFYAADLNHDSEGVSMAPIRNGNTNFFFRFRAGYEHVNHGDNNDSYFLSAKFYAYGDGLRERVNHNGWLIPDAEAEISSQYLPKTDQDHNPGSDDGTRFRVGFSWPWIHWTARLFAQNHSVCPLCQPLALGLGPTVNFGFDHLYNETEFRFAHYAGARLTFNRDGFIEYTLGDTAGLDGTRQQLIAEIPFYESRDGEVRYYLRGLWNRGDHSKPDLLEGGIFVEMPFGTLANPCKWGDLVPFCK